MIFKDKRTHEVWFESDAISYLNTVSVIDGGSLYLTGKTRGFNMGSDITLNDDSTLCGDRVLRLNGYTLTVDGSFNQEGGVTVDLSGSTMKVSENYWHKSGVLMLNDSTLQIGRNYEMRAAADKAGTGDLQMVGEGSNIVDVAGDVIIDTLNGRSYYQKTGVLAVGGDLKVYATDGGQGLEMQSDTTVYFTGRRKHEVWFESDAISYMTNVVVVDNGSLHLTGKTRGFNMASDITLTDGSKLCGSTALNLNGNTLTVNGDFVHEGDLTVNLAGSTMKVNGSYRHQHGILSLNQSQLFISGNYESFVAPGTAGTGDLRLEGTESNVMDVDGDVIIDTVNGRSYYQKTGTLAIGGDLKVYATDGGQGLEMAEGTYLCFKNGGEHIVYFESDLLSYITNLGTIDGAVLRLTGNTRGFRILSDLKLADGSVICGNNPLYLNGNTLQVNGDFIQKGGLTVDATGSTMRVHGDYRQQHGCLKLDDSRLEISGSYRLEEAPGTPGDGELQMTGEPNVMEVNGDVIIDSVIGRSYYQKSGTVIIGGDLKVYAPNDGQGLELQGDSYVGFKGTKQHEVFFESDQLSYLSHVIVLDGGSLYLNGKTRGFMLHSDAIFADGSSLNGGTFNLNGNNVTVTGSFTQNGTNIDLNGGTMKVGGDYLHQNGVLNLNGGKLNIQKNYEMQSPDGTACSGEIQTEGDGALITGGDFIINSTINHSYWQKSGRFIIGGDLKVYAPEGGSGFNPNGMTVALIGGKAHAVYFEGTGSATDVICLGLGDSISFTGALNGITRTAESKITVDPAELAVISGLTVTAAEMGECSIEFSNGADTVTKKLYIGEYVSEVYDGAVPPVVTQTNRKGDVNADGFVSIADVVLMQRYLTAAPDTELAGWKNGDLNEDGRLTATDFTMLKHMMIETLNSGARYGTPAVSQSGTLPVAEFPADEDRKISVKKQENVNI